MDDPKRRDQELRRGTLPVSWGSGDFDRDTPDFQIHAYNEDLYILRQSGRSHYEKPFLYLLFGSERALLLDTGAGTAEVARAVDRVVEAWLARTGRPSLPLVVAHTHTHDDHIAGDHQFANRPLTTLVAPDLQIVQEFFGFTSWPEEIVSFDLGGRVLDIMGIPGHEKTSIAVYDRQTGILITGDTLYPGRLYVDDPPAFARSIERLVRFTRERIVTHILGCHIENTRTPFVDYPVGTTDQPEEHTLELGRAHLLELNDAIARMETGFARQVLRDFTIWPVDPPPQP